ncbi:VOC family protein [Myxococcota bacterium]|nr:VOC family protein [Myxococcota bacterium]
MLTKAAHHYSLVVSDVEKSKKFYTDLLGLSEIPRPDFGIPGVWYQAGPVQLHLIQVPEGVDVGMVSPALTPLAAHIAFEIDNYERVEAELQAVGIELQAAGGRAGQIFVRDPDGNTIEFIDPSRQPGRV